MAIDQMTVITVDGQRVLAWLTTEHAASSYGLPIVVIEDCGLGPLDLEVAYPGYRLDGTMAARAVALMTGYRVVDPPRVPRRVEW